MSELKRYDFEADYDMANVDRVEHPQGDYVLYSDAAALLAEKDAEIERLRDYQTRTMFTEDENQRLRNAIETTLSENKHLADGERCTLWRLKQALAATAQGEEWFKNAEYYKAEIERLLEALTEIAENFYPTTEYDGALCAVEDMRDIAKQALAATAQERG